MSEPSTETATAAAEAATEAATTSPPADETENGGEESESQQPTEQDKTKEGEEPSESFDAELEAMKKRLQQMEQETSTMHTTGGNGMSLPMDGGGDEHVTINNPSVGTASSSGVPGANVEGLPQNQTPPGVVIDETTADSDSRSIYVGNVDYYATGEELNQHFQECGTINRVTIMCHKATGQPKGYAYIEFKERDSVQNALILNESSFRGRQLKVVEKRTNIPGVTRGGIGGVRGGYRGRYNRGGWRGGSGYRGRPRGARGGRGRGVRWAPY